MPMINEGPVKKPMMTATKPPAWLGATGGAGGIQRGINPGANVDANYNTSFDAAYYDRQAQLDEARRRAAVMAQVSGRDDARQVVVKGPVYMPGGMSPSQRSQVPAWLAPERTNPQPTPNPDGTPPGPDSFVAGGGQAVRNSKGAYWLPQNLPDYPTGTFFGAGGQLVAGPLTGVGGPVIGPDYGSGGGGGFGTSYRGWGGGGGGGGYASPAWLADMGLFNWNYKG